MVLEHTKEINSHVDFSLESTTKEMDLVSPEELSTELKKVSIDTPYVQEQYQHDFVSLIDTLLMSNRNFIKEGQQAFAGTELITKEKILLTHPDIVKAWIIQHNQIIAEKQFFIWKKIDVLSQKLMNIKNTISSWWKDSADYKKDISSLERQLLYFTNQYQNLASPISPSQFMHTFLSEQNIARKYQENQTITETIKIINEPVIVTTDAQTQEVWKFVELSDINKNAIKIQLDKVLKLQQEIVGLEIIGRADSTWPRSKDLPWEQVDKSRDQLKSKWFDLSLLDYVQLADGKKISVDQFLGDKDDTNKLNQTWAYARALMQFDFLDADQLSLLQNSQSFVVVIDAQTVWDETKRVINIREELWKLIPREMKELKSKNILLL
jgi:hypothetical protein